MGWPANSSLARPNMVRAAWLQAMTVPLLSVTMIASMADCIKVRNCSSLSRSARSARHRSVTSRVTTMQCVTVAC